MDNTPHHLLVRPTPAADADGIGPEQAPPAPHFDEKAIQQARPAVPLEQVKARLLWLVVVLMCSSALLGVVIGLTISQQNGSEHLSMSAPSVAPEASGVTTESGTDRIATSTASESEPASVVANTEEKAN